MRRIAFINEKGGTCKTTLCVNVAAWLAGAGRRVLLADLDTQGHAGKSLGVDVRGLAPTVHDLLLGRARLEEVVRPTPVANLSLLPANKALAGFPMEVAHAADRADRLREALQGVPADGYDYLLVDAPPSVSLVTENVLRAADELVIPVALTYLALDGCAEIVESLERLRAERGQAPRISLVVPALYRKTQLADEILAKLRERFPAEVSRAVLGWSVKVDEAQSHGMTIFEYAPASSGAGQLASIAAELEARGAGAPGAPQAS
ncbi:ParA family protein [Anaeromyxobacter paludicola]|uniref:Cobyrinic acid a,c-diamide synthase n=1 Tax=Anaeromyxobacter paludicola TaxID=2918171 RepID=A0ABM7X9E0_9BACT|nr:ParA family protein [Anaeromyxobacter paludicola]BDG08430.1 cobyrinic acid a,c-diamide synthase [Anaeromyxobacter paludicola]